MKKKIFIFIIIFLSCKKAFSCDCSLFSGTEVAVQMAYKKSPVIVLGRLIDIKNDFYTIEVIEYLKGDGKNKMTIFLEGSCSFKIKNDELWLLYLEKTKTGGFTTNQCFPNRLFPKMNLLSFPPPPIDSSIDMKEPYLRTILMYQELISLRQKKIINDFNQYKIEESAPKAKSNNKNSYLNLSVLFVILCFAPLNNRT